MGKSHIKDKCSLFDSLLYLGMGGILGGGGINNPSRTSKETTAPTINNGPKILIRPCLETIKKKS